MKSFLTFFFLIIAAFPLLSAQSQKTISNRYNLDSKSFKEFKHSLSLLDKESKSSEKYINTVHHLEKTYYNDASFETLLLLSKIYYNKKDYKNQLKTLNMLVSDYPKNPASHYRLGLAYKNSFLRTKTSGDKQKSITFLSNAIKKNRTYSAAYKNLLPLMMNGETHTSDSLDLITEMIRYLKKDKNYKSYYTLLCQSYFDNSFLIQTRTACLKAIKKNPNNPINKILLALSEEKEKEIKKKVREVADKYPDSEYVQKKAGFFFLKKNPTLGISFLEKALKLNPNSLLLIETLAYALLKEGEIKKSYPYFFKSCILSRGAFMPKFHKVANQVSYKGKEFKTLFKKGTEECFSKIKSKK